MKRVISIIILVAIISGVMFFTSDNASATVTQRYEKKEELKIPVLMYHHIDKNIDNAFNSTVVTPEEFEKTLERIKYYGYTAISLSQLNDIYDNGSTNILKPIVITFDDGYLSNYEYAFSILKEYNMKANIFIIVSNVGKTPGLFPHFTWDQAKEMEKSGLIEIQNHTNLHEIANTIPDEEFLTSVETAQIELEKQLGKRKVKALAYPEGRYNEYLLAKLGEKGFKLQFTVEKGINSLDDRPEKLKRINVPHSESGKNIIDSISRFGFLY